MIDARTVLDIGAGTGRAIRHLMDNMPDLQVRGVEPVAARIEQGVQNKGIPRGVVIQGVGEALPFEESKHRRGLRLRHASSCEESGECYPRNDAGCA